ncbi:MAG: glycosyltransferase [Deltaproteobacteria bacterium]|jgi:hypothetical protein|nr:glycosyltransferase [Deltaproteobacteria bacterium]
MNILCLNLKTPALALRAQGHAVLELSLDRGMHRLEPILRQQDFTPDLFVQRELLGERVLCVDLPTLPCVRAFWSVDTHLNLFWQWQYAQLFDVLLTPHPSFVHALPERMRPPALRHLPWWGEALPWVPHAARQHDISFVGRQNPSARPLRAYLGTLLRGLYGVPLQDGLSRQDMLNLYTQTRLLPNESIAFEANFRLLEGASAGCCLLTPDIGEDQNTQLDPGTECLIYHDGLELLELLELCRHRPNMAERIGLAAYRRVQACHLPAHRAAALSELAGLARSGANGEAASLHLWLTLAHIGRDQQDAHLCGQAMDMLECLPPSPENLAMRLQLAWETGRTETATALLHTALARQDALCLDLAGFGVAALQRDLESARLFARRLPKTQTDSLEGMCLDWARHLAAEGYDWQPGFHIAVGRHCPGSALEMIMLARLLGAPDALCAELTSALPAVQRHMGFVLMGSLARLVLEAGDDWRIRTDLGLAYLRCYRVQEGLDELTLARDHACRLDQDGAFTELLHARGASHAVKALSGQGN